MSSKQTHSGAGRKPRYKTAMTKLNVRVPVEVKAALIEQYGGVQAAIDELVIKPVLENKENK